MASIWPRQTQVVETADGEVFVYNERSGFWWTRTGRIVRWSIFLGLFTLFLAYMIIGYWHAKRRLSKGLAPLRYHRWLLNSQQRAINEPEYQNPQVFYNNPTQYQYQYNMNPMPPPMYNPNAGMPPTYSPPEGATKVDPSQWRAEPTRRPAETGGGEQAPGYDAPGGPPPAAAALRPDNTGASNK